MMQAKTRSDMGPGNHKDGSHNGANTRSRQVRPKYKNPLLKDVDVTRMPTTPHWMAGSAEQPPVWQYESPDYEVESSVPTLSLIVSEVPVSPSIDEVDTRPALPTNSYLPDTLRTAASIDEVDTRPALLLTKRRSRGRNPIDRVRWWLLYPGRIEFMLWLCGTLLLIGVTCMLLLVTALSFGWIVPGQQSGMVLQNPASSSTSSTEPTLTLIDRGPFSPGQIIRLHGQGFSVRGRIVFTFDSAVLNPSQNVAGQLVYQPQVNADNHGEFTAPVTLGSGPAWKGGQHRIVAHDLATKRLAFLMIQLIPSRVTPTPVSSTGTANGSIPVTPVATAPPPAKSTPPPVTTATATPTQAPPTPTPTATATPTTAVTPTPSVTPGVANGAMIHASITIPGPASFSTSLVDTQSPCQADFHRCAMIAPVVLTWLLVCAYSLAVPVLVTAAMLRRMRSKSLW